MAIPKTVGDLICEVCKKNKAIGVACSPLGPISLAYCKECLDNRADALWLIEATVEMAGGPEHIAAWFWEMTTYKDGAYLSVAKLYGRQQTMDMI